MEPETCSTFKIEITTNLFYKNYSECNDCSSKRELKRYY